MPTFIGPDTILVGHSLESDLNILGLCHEHIIDTVGLFPHSQGLPYKKSLKLVAKEQLHRDIQSDKKDPVAPIDPNVQDEIIGHDSIEDACIPLELLFQLVIDHYQQLPTEQQETGRHKFLPNVWSSTHSLLSAPNISNTSTTTTAATAGDQPQISCERYTIFHSLIDCQRQSGSHDGLLGNFHLCEPYRHIPPWERYSMGYRHDSNISLAYQQFIDDPYLSSTTKDQIRMNIHHHGSVSDAISGAIHSLQSSESSSSSSSQPHFVWIDMPCNLNVASQPTKSCQGDCLSPHDINHHLEQILSNTQSGDVVCVLTQGDLLDVKKNICKKQK